MKHSRTLRLAKEPLGDLTPAQLAVIAAGRGPETEETYDPTCRTGWVVEIRNSFTCTMTCLC